MNGMPSSGQGEPEERFFAYFEGAVTLMCRDVRAHFRGNYSWLAGQEPYQRGKERGVPHLADVEAGVAGALGLYRCAKKTRHLAR